MKGNRIMLTVNETRIHTLTSRDVDRIRGLLQSVEEAIAEILAYRAIRPLDPAADLPMEDDVYRQTSGIMEAYNEAPLDSLF